MDICKFSGSPVFAPGTSDLLVGAAVRVYLTGTSTPATVYQEPGASTPHPYPIIVGSDGLIPAIYWGEGTFRIRVEVSSSDNSPVWDFDGIKGEIVPTTGGGGGDVVPVSERVQTGMVHWEPIDGLRDGYVRLNDRTIGDASSAATERANADCEDLFAYLWNGLTDTYATVSGGRGANASSDWAAHKTIKLPSTLGRVLMGLDTMGNAAANISQKTTTISTTSASTTATVASAAGLTRGMYVVSENVPAGATITAIQGTTITMSLAASATASGTAVRFSMIRDAEKPGATGGVTSIQQNEDELATHDHPITDPTHSHGHVYSTGSPGAGTNGFVMSNVQTGNTSGRILAASTGITVNEVGLGQAMNVVQPGIAGTFFIKL